MLCLLQVLFLRFVLCCCFLGLVSWPGPALPLLTDLSPVEKWCF